MISANPQGLFRSIFGTQEEEITCAICFELLDIYVDTEISGADAATLLPYVHQHLGCCAQCIKLYDGLKQIAGMDGQDRDLRPANTEVL